MMLQNLRSVCYRLKKNDLEVLMKTRNFYVFVYHNENHFLKKKSSIKNDF